MSIELQDSPTSIPTVHKPLHFISRPPPSESSPSSPTILCLHGLYSSHHEFARIPFPDTYHILVPDLPGHSDSSHLPVTLSTATAELANLIRTHAHNSRAHLVGVHFGGYIALHLAAVHPELIDTVFVSGCSMPTTGILAAMSAPLSWVVQKPMLYFSNVFNWSLSWYGNVLPDEVMLEMQRNTTLALGNAAHAALQKEFTLKPVEKRVCVTGGSKGDLIRPLWEMEKVLKEGNAQSRAVVARGMILAWDVQAPEAFGDAVVRWIEGRELPEFMVSLEKWSAWT